MSKITSITGEIIKDSRGKDALVVTVQAGKAQGTFATPSGASTGVHEIMEVSAEEGVRQLKEEISTGLIGESVFDQRLIDEKLKKLGAGGDARIGTSVGVAKAAAASKQLETYEYLKTLSEMKQTHASPRLFMNLINGGAHAVGGGSVQEYWVIPDVEDLSEAYNLGVRIEENLKDILGDEIEMGDEGGYLIREKTVHERFEILRKAVGDLPVRLGADVAATDFYKEGNYNFDGKSLDLNSYTETLENIIKTFALYAIEDPFQEEDFESFAKLHTSVDSFVVGDDLTTTNKQRLEKAVLNKSINSVIIKPNQVGTLSDTLDAMKYARESNIHCIVSHRSGETMDTFIADLAYAFGCLGLKAGAPGQKERDIKYKRLIEITN